MPTASSLVVDLPNDVWLEIAEWTRAYWFGLAALAALVRVSKRIHNVAFQILYQQIVLLPMKRSRYKALCGMIESNDAAAMAVRSLTLHGSVFERKTYSKLAKQVLRRVENVSSLQLVGTFPWYWDSHKTVFPKLRDLVFDKKLRGDTKSLVARHSDMIQQISIDPPEEYDPEDADGDPDPAINSDSDSDSEAAYGNESDEKSEDGDEQEQTDSDEESSGESEGNDGDSSDPSSDGHSSNANVRHKPASERRDARSLRSFTKLRSFKGPFSRLCNFLPPVSPAKPLPGSPPPPSPPLESLTVWLKRSGSDDPEDLFLPLKAVKHTLSRITVHACEWSAKYLSSIATRTPGVLDLTYIAVDEVDVDLEDEVLWSQWFLNDLEEIMPKFKALRSLELVGRDEEHYCSSDIGLPGTETYIKEYSLLESWVEVCPTLKSCVFPLHNLHWKRVESPSVTDQEDSDSDSDIPVPTSLVWVPDWTHDGTCARVLQLSPSDIRDDLDDYPWIKIFTKEVHEGCDEEDYYDLTAVGQDPMICGIAAVEKALYPDDENPMDEDEDAEEYYYRQLSFYADLHDQVMPPPEALQRFRDWGLAILRK